MIEDFLNDTKRVNGFLTEIFELDYEESDAVNGFIPMTKEIYFRVMDKCMCLGERAEHIFINLLIEHPDFAVEYEEFLQGLVESGEWKKMFLCN